MDRARNPWWEATGTVLAEDGVPLAFAWAGEPGARAMVCAHGVGVSNASYFWDYIATHFSENGHEVVIWDYPGHGASAPPRDPSALSIPLLAEQMIRVMDARDIERAVFLGHSMGCQVIFEAYNRFPDRVIGLIPTLGSWGRLADNFLDPRIGRSLVQAGYEVGTRIPNLINAGLRLAMNHPIAWHVTRLSGLVHPKLARREDMEPYLEHLAEVDVRVFFELVRAAQEHDAGPMLHEIEVPTLIVAGERDLFTPRHLSMEMAERIPNAELLEVPSGTHAALIEQPELINLRIEKFLAEQIEPYEAQIHAKAERRPMAGVG